MIVQLAAGPLYLFTLHDSLRATLIGLTVGTARDDRDPASGESWRGAWHSRAAAPVRACSQAIQMSKLAPRLAPRSLLG